MGSRTCYYLYSTEKHRQYLFYLGIMLLVVTPFIEKGAVYYYITTSLYHNESYRHSHATFWIAGPSLHHQALMSTLNNLALIHITISLYYYYITTSLNHSEAYRYSHATFWIAGSYLHHQASMSTLNNLALMSQACH